MSRNIKEIGKELLGKSLNSYHRRTGLTQLEKNNNIQDGILDGILSQVDDAYIEKTEQSNVIHLEGSGDGAVVVDEIEGNTLVNLIKMTSPYIATVESFQNANIKLNQPLKANTVYTRFYHVKTLQKGDVIEYPTMYDMVQGTTNKQYSKHLNSLGWHTSKFTNLYDGHGYQIIVDNYWRRNNTNDCKLEIDNFFILEGDWTDKPMPTHFEGLQSSFEEKVNDEGKYEIEILMKNKNLYKKQDVNIDNVLVSRIETTIKDENILVNNKNTETFNYIANIFTEVGSGLSYKINYENTGCLSSYTYFDPRVIFVDENKNEIGTPVYGDITKNTYIAPKGAKYLYTQLRCRVGTPLGAGGINNICIYVSNNDNSYVKPKQNKIKLLLNSPLLKGDKLVVKDGKLQHYHKMKQMKITDRSQLKYMGTYPTNEGYLCKHFNLLNTEPPKPYTDCYCDNISVLIPKGDGYSALSYTPSLAIAYQGMLYVTAKISDYAEPIDYLLAKTPTIVYELAEPYYEEVLNEYGEPVMLEGYENGTVYIDSVITPTTTLRYTPKMESLKTLKAVNHNNIMLTDDINNNIIDYMMNVDLMIMEKEMQITKTRRIGEKDMTNMQKRTFDMLKRLIKGKTLTEQECKDRVVLYLSAEKITSEQAEELMLYISEIYA